MTAEYFTGPFQKPLHRIDIALNRFVKKSQARVGPRGNAAAPRSSGGLKGGEAPSPLVSIKGNDELLRVVLVELGRIRAVSRSEGFAKGGELLTRRGGSGALPVRMRRQYLS